VLDRTASLPIFTFSWTMDGHVMMIRGQNDRRKACVSTGFRGPLEAGNDWKHAVTVVAAVSCVAAISVASQLRCFRRRLSYDDRPTDRQTDGQTLEHCRLSRGSVPSRLCRIILPLVVTRVPRLIYRSTPGVTSSANNWPPQPLAIVCRMASGA